ncbi:NADH:ubiquinone reductase (Na(+)-transporting) subunit D [Sphingobacteriales bacterium UPWRP_1]|nr:NADH:ubiquinone reductase (Na(+)-transporting) subunit D [Sphingobacteriales bacterium TSM_CSM]PSJ78460.1 NADH:ubiquinone reductase (Na(+)-transporting) subunit D [Sphingobacteriales bacterium UPWRP_1]
MSQATETTPVKEQKKEGLFSSKNRHLLTDPIGDNNPITIQVLGLCSALAVTTQLKPAIIMAIGVTIVTAFSNLIISALRNTIPNRIRMIVQLVVIAALVVIVDQLLRAFVYDVSKKLSVFIGLIITNCIVMGRLEAFAMANKPWPSFLDGIGNGLGYGAILVIIALLRESLGSGTILGYQIIPQALYTAGYVNNGLMVTPAASMFIIAIIIWIQRSRNPKLVDIS